jgi:thiol-disulfide isomerase/thioredoxin
VLTVPTFSGKSATVGGPARQEVTLINLWATFCGPCIQEFPALEAVHQRYAPRGLRVLAVSVDRGDAEVKAFLMSHPVTFQIGRDPSGTVSTAIANATLPQNVLVSADGRILYRSEGFGGEMPAALLAAIDSAVAPH